MHSTLPLLSFVALLSMVSACSPVSGAEEPPSVAGTVDAGDRFQKVDVATVGMDLRAQAPVVLLRQPETGQVLPIWVGLPEAQAIARVLHGVEMPRPMTHDLMASLLKEAKATVDEVLVHDLRGGTYFGMVRLKLDGDETILEVDSRPSDALALALRVGAPIRVAPEILVDTPDFDFMAPEGPDQVVRILGVTVVAPNPELRERFGLPEREGLVVTDVAADIEERGLRKGDLIVEVNSLVPRVPIDFFEAVMETPAGTDVEIRFWRDGEEFTIEIPSVTREPDIGRPDPSIRI